MNAMHRNISENTVYSSVMTIIATFDQIESATTFSKGGCSRPKH